jgi:hypothetical protein
MTLSNLEYCDIMFHVWTCFYIFAKVVHELHGLRHLDNYLDDFFLAEMSDIECFNNMWENEIYQ